MHGRSKGAWLASSSTPSGSPSGGSGKSGDSDPAKRRFFFFFSGAKRDTLVRLASEVCRGPLRASRRRPSSACHARTKSAHSRHRPRARTESDTRSPRGARHISCSGCGGGGRRRCWRWCNEAVRRVHGCGAPGAVLSPCLQPVAAPTQRLASLAAHQGRTSASPAQAKPCPRCAMAASRRRRAQLARRRQRAESLGALRSAGMLAALGCWVELHWWWRRRTAAPRRAGCRGRRRVG